MLRHPLCTHKRVYSLRLLNLVPTSSSDSAEVGSHLHLLEDKEHEGKYWKQPTILVVEDDPLLKEYVTDLLKMHHYSVFTTENMQEALKYLEDPNESIQLLFSDIRIPGYGSGVTLALKARQLRPSLNILLTTGFVEEYLKDKLDDSFPIIEKPYFPNELINKIQSILGKG